MLLFCRHQNSIGLFGARLAVALAALGLVWAIAACGVKAPPVAPGAKPPILASFGHHLENDLLTLRWTFAAGSSQPESMTLYRARSPLAEKPCDGCPLVFKPLQTIAAADLEKGSLALTLESGFHYGFKMRATAENGVTGPDSQTIIIEY